MTWPLSSPVKLLFCMQRIDTVLPGFIPVSAVLLSFQQFYKVLVMPPAEHCNLLSNHRWQAAGRAHAAPPFLSCCTNRSTTC